MKKLLFAALFLLGMGLMSVSCDKEGIRDEAYLEGRWWVPVRGELLLNGKVACDKPSHDFILDFKAFFENGSYTCVDMESGESYVFGYSYIDGILRLGVFLGNSIELNVHKITKKEGVVDLYVQSEISEAPESGIYRETVIDTYLGTDIYTYAILGIYVYFEGLEYWYYDKNGNKVPCKYGEHTLIQEWNEGKGDYDTKDSFDFWYDTERFYFKAE